MEQVAHRWNAKQYNDKYSFVYDYGKSLIKLLDPQPKEQVLDLGCGSGQLTSEIAAFGSEVTGIDKSESMIEEAKKRFPNLHFEVGDATSYDAEGTYDAVFSNAALHWVTDYQEAIVKMYQNLKPGGRLVVELGGEGNVEAIVSALRHSLLTHGFVEQSNLKLWYFPSVSEYTWALEAEGFKVTFAQWYERSTELADEESGLRDWLGMFAKPFFKGVDKKMVSEIISEVEQTIKPELYQEGKWLADYKRIRVVAQKI
ncbi:class I SAM-dependent methyltransferase [Euzebyella marina]|uniref:Class I SAM-dependent methyltransferase n=1 Tax=Euzebyella marina TaxID=1761453 RepID=A0A3G2L7D3_9FLAO|nr:class I SAM-dependent methyltransferase [Euzebyella marina]AYN68194.1 class I SAM-dependent methyltransferase [Euzebyella marina]